MVSSSVIIFLSLQLNVFHGVCSYSYGVDVEGGVWWYGVVGGPGSGSICGCEVDSLCAYNGHHTLRVGGGGYGYIYCFFGIDTFWSDFRVDDGWGVVYCEGEWCLVGVTHMVPGHD